MRNEPPIGGRIDRKFRGSSIAEKKRRGWKSLSRENNVNFLSRVQLKNLDIFVSIRIIFFTDKLRIYELIIL